MDMKARWWERERGGDASVVRCGLCFRGCRIEAGHAGVCGVRLNRDGELVSPWLGRFCTPSIDPIEKKPLARWHPGTYIYSLGSFGCTMDCAFCQNHHIARPIKLLDPETIPYLAPEDLVKNVQAEGLNSVAFTYNEPTLQSEYALEAAPLLREAGIDLVMVTNGALSEAAALDLAPWVSAANIDLKVFTDTGYKTLSGDLDSVKRTIELWVRAGVHVELTSLIVPGLNDDAGKFAAMTDWIAALSTDIVLHVTRYFPARRCAMPPTDVKLLWSFADIARAKLKFVYMGNVI